MMTDLADLTAPGDVAFNKVSEQYSKYVSQRTTKGQQFSVPNYTSTGGLQSSVPFGPSNASQGSYQTGLNNTLNNTNTATNVNWTPGTTQAPGIFDEQ